MTLKMRNFDWDNDFELVREFLTDCYFKTNSLQSWIPQRFENRKFGPCGTEYQKEEDDLVKIWELVNEKDDSYRSKIIAITVLTTSSESWVFVHPNFKEFEKDLIIWIEKQLILRKKGDTDIATIDFYVTSDDKHKTALLKEMGYLDLGFDEYTRIRPSELSPPDYQLAEGYTIRSVNIEDDFQNYRQVIASVFPHCNKMTLKLAQKYGSASFYCPELDLVAIDSHGEFAAFCTIRFDSYSKIAEFEPVGTNMNHRRLGLAKSLISEGLIRLTKFQPKVICIPGAAANEGANKLYDSLGFTIKEELHLWQKKL
ncbi:MAG: GNAT family N-acetyltransferase [Asgard group archaeon]|nr:GNAT family N-acetyltransferase [Asgard group archaeon]